MSTPENRDLPPGVVELATVMQQQLLEGGVPDQVFERAQEVAPAILIACGAVALSGEPDMHTAVQHLFGSRKLQRQVLAQLNHPELHQTLPGPDAKRLAALRREATETRAIEITSLRKGEPLTLLYESSERGAKPSRAVLEVMRNEAGSTIDRLSLLILAAGGEPLGPRRNRLRVGQTVYLGYVATPPAMHDSALMLGTTPAWVTGLYKTGKNDWHYRQLFQASGFTLRQIYYGKGDSYPLFPN